MRCGSGTACGGVAGFFPHAPWRNPYRCSRAPAAESGRGLHSSFGAVVVLITFDSYQKLSKCPRAGTVMKDNYEKLNSSATVGGN